MAVASIERRLAAILAADVVGYSRLMEADEEGTLRRFEICRTALDSLIRDYHGRVFGGAGDSVIAEFASAVEAVRCAIAIQDRIEQQNAGQPADRHMRFRIGIHLGDVMVHGSNLLGDGVNIASRLEGLAVPGSMLISGPAFDQVEGKLDRRFEFVGERTVKNIERPVRMYRPSGSSRGGAPSALRMVSLRRIGGRLVGLAMVVALGVIAWFLYLQPSIQERAYSETTALPLPDKPSIAVLPFANLSGDPAQEYFSDGITDSLITDLSQVSGLFVIARNSVFTYKNRPVNVPQVGRELGVRYVLEGSVQRAGERIRINSQLIDAANGFHLWADRYDSELEDVFALQDNVAQQIVAALKVQLTERERDSLTRRYTDSLEAYDYYLRGRDLVSDESEQGFLRGRALFEKAIALDPDYVPAYAQLAYAMVRDVSGVTGTRDADLTEAYQLLQKALRLDDTIPLNHFVMAYVHRQHRQHEEAIASLERALELDPNYADAYAFLSTVLSFAGRADEALEMIEKAKRLNPTMSFGYFQADAFAYFTLGRYEDAIDALTRSLQRNPTSVLSRVFLAASYANAGRLADAEWEVAELRTLDPNLSIAQVREWAPFTTRKPLERLLDGLRQAGLLEETATGNN